jgi:benzoylformate decarboxylase
MMTETCPASEAVSVPMAFPVPAAVCRFTSAGRPVTCDPVRHRLTITRARSLYIPAAGGLGWGLPAAIGVQLAEPDRPVLAVLGDGAMQDTTSGLWTATRHNIPVTFIICTNTKYRALEDLSELMHVPDGDYLEILEK